MVEYQNDLYNRSVKERSIKIVNFTQGKAYEGGDKDYVYKNGRIYAPVFVGEPLVIFEDSYSLGKDVEWTTDNLIQFENQMTVESFEYLAKTKYCTSCEFASACVSRGLTKMMKTLNVTDCFAPKPAFIQLRQVA